MSHKSYWLDVIKLYFVLLMYVLFVLITCDTLINIYLLTLWDMANSIALDVIQLGIFCLLERNFMENEIKIQKYS